MTLDDIKKLVTPEGVKNALEPQLFGSLTGISADTIATPRNTYQDDFDFETIEDVLESESYPTQVWPAILVTACNNAATWAYVTILKAGKIDTNCTDDQLSVMSTAITKRAIYELGRISQFDDNFYKDKTEAQNLLDAILGLTSREGDSAGAFYFGASITKDENSNSKNLNPLFKFAKRW
ncbi:hypothetical protein ACPV36_04885 [Photobacterium damselae]|uniref:hypothetical protein n=1 Tax=Photobacterium damselae TaxID=38293 RepID=UPI004068464E